MHDGTRMGRDTSTLAGWASTYGRSVHAQGGLGIIVFSLTLGVGCGGASRQTSSAMGPESHAHDPHHHGGYESGHHHHAFKDAEAWSKVFDDRARDEWQLPDEVLRALELEPTMTVADVGAGTGYFAVRLARAVPQGEVIATDVEPDMVRYLTERAQREGLTNVRVIQGTQDASGLAPTSVDRILLVHVWHHLTDRAAFARDLAAALRPGGRVFVVDFQRTARRGPPVEMRLEPEEIIADFERGGLSAMLSPVVLPDQYIVEARPR